MVDFINKIIQGHCIEKMKEIPDNFVNTIVTSPPYYGLRDYGTGQWVGGDQGCEHDKSKELCNKCGAVKTDSQIGLEKTPELYVQKIVEVFNECKRILKPDGTLWLNIGDSYWGSGNASGYTDKTTNLGVVTQNYGATKGHSQKKHVSIKPKDLIGIPWMVAFALRSAGWYLRQDIIWHKPNPMPESVTDRCTKSHEYIFLLSKSPKYYYDYKSIMTDSLNPQDDIRRISQQKQSNKSNPDAKVNGLRPRDNWNGSSFDTGKTGEMKSTRGGRKSGNIERKTGAERGCPEGSGSNVCGSVPWEGSKSNKRSVWTVTTKPLKEAHFATFPQDLITDCIKAGCPEGGVVFDPFMGAGTTAVVAKKLNRNYLGIELNPEYIKIKDARMFEEFGLFI